MYNGKVVICGVDTSKLPLLKETEKEELIRRAKRGEQAARIALINGNLRLVLSVVKRFWGRGENPDDLFQIGCIGLIKSIDNFDVTQNVKFSTYAVPMIIGEIRRYLRDNNSVKISRCIKDNAYKVMKAKEEFVAKNGCEPTVSQISEILEIPREDIVIALESSIEPISLYEPVFSENGDSFYILDKIGDDTDGQNQLYEIAIRDEISKLSKREKTILNLRFIKGKTQMEVSKQIGISQAQVSRLEKNAIKKIKS